MFPSLELHLVIQGWELEHLWSVNEAYSGNSGKVICWSLSSQTNNETPVTTATRSWLHDASQGGPGPLQNDTSIYPDISLDYIVFDYISFTQFSSTYQNSTWQIMSKQSVKKNNSCAFFAACQDWDVLHKKKGEKPTGAFLLWHNISFFILPYICRAAEALRPKILLWLWFGLADWQAFTR